MPSRSPKQARTMRACAHGAALGVCEKIPMTVAKEFVEADKRRDTSKHGYFRMNKKQGGL